MLAEPWRYFPTSMAEQVPREILVSTVLAVCVVVSQGISQLYFTTEPSSVTAQVGESVVLPCHATGEQPINITWFRGTEQLHNHNGTSKIHSNGSLWLQLTGEDFDTNSESQVEVFHRCCATNVKGTLCSPNVSVIAIAPSSKPVVLPQRLDVVQNTSARLKCKTNDASSQYSIHWQKNHQELQHSSRYVFLPAGVLQIYMVQPEDAGEYRCITNNPATPLTTSESSQLVVVSNKMSSLEEPVEVTAIIEGPRDVMMTSPGGQMILECLAAGSWVDITWSRSGGKQLPVGRSHFIGRKNLELVSLIPDDSGAYTCEATDTRTEEVFLASALVKINDFYPPQFTVRPQSGQMEYMYGATLRLQCSANGNPKPMIFWYHNGKLIKPSRHVHVTHDPDTNDLVIWFVSKEHEGIYQCFASNMVGTIQSSALITVKVVANQPDPPYNLTTQTIDSNTIDISWQVDGEIYLFSLHYYIEPDGDELQSAFVNQHSNLYRVTDLRPFSNYTFYMHAYSTSPSGKSELVQGQTAEGVPIVSPNFWLASIEANTIVIHWDHITDVKLSRGYINKYRICYQQHEMPQDKVCLEVDRFQDTYRILGLKPDTVYDIQMAAATLAGFGPDAVVQSIRIMDIGNCSVPPMFPLDLPVILNDTEVLLAWSEQFTDGRIPITGFLLQLSGVTQGSGILLPPNTYSYVFSNLLPGLQHTAQLTAYNDCDLGPASLQTFALPSISEDGNSFLPPENVKAEALSSTSIKISWDPLPALSGLFYKVIYYQTLYRRKTETEVYRQTTHAVLTDLKPFTNYTLQVRVHHSGDIGQYSEEVYCRTAEDVPSAPVSFTATPIDPHTVSVTWLPPLNPNGIIKMYNIRYVNIPPKLEEQLEFNWNYTHRNGTDTSATIHNLSSNTKYYFLLAACTSVGEGQATTVREVEMPPEVNFKVGSGTGNGHGINSDVEKGVLIAVLLGSVCLVLCTLMTAIRFKRYQTTRSRRMQAQTVGTGCNGVVPRGSLGMEMTVLSPMLGDVNLQRHISHPNGQIHCESPLLSANQLHPNELVQHSESLTQQSQDSGHSEPLPGAEHHQQELQQYRHTLPGSCAHKSTTKQGCSVSLPESGCEDAGAEDSIDRHSHWTHLRESTSGDSGLIGDMEFAGSEDTSPDFIEKVLREFRIGIHKM